MNLVWGDIFNLCTVTIATDSINIQVHSFSFPPTVPWQLVKVTCVSFNHTGIDSLRRGQISMCQRFAFDKFPHEISAEEVELVYNPILRSQLVLYQTSRVQLRYIS